MVMENERTKSFFDQLAVDSEPSTSDVADAVDQVLYVDDTLYADVVESAVVQRARFGISERDAQIEAEGVLLREARLLDLRNYEEWLSLLTDDCVYWVPSDMGSSDPRRCVSIHFDDHRRLGDRVALIRTGFLHAQTPPSRTCRTVTNIEGWRRANGSIDARSNLVIWEYRWERMHSWVGWQEHHIVRRDGEWRIKRKTIGLLDCDEAQGNLTFIL